MGSDGAGFETGRAVDRVQECAVLSPSRAGGQHLEPCVACVLAVKELSEVSGKALLPGFGDDEEDNEDTISRTVQEITALFRECERRLKEIHNARDEGSGDEKPHHRE